MRRTFHGVVMQLANGLQDGTIVLRESSLIDDLLEHTRKVLSSLLDARDADVQEVKDTFSALADDIKHVEDAIWDRLYAQKQKERSLVRIFEWRSIESLQAAHLKMAIRQARFRGLAQAQREAKAVAESPMDPVNWYAVSHRSERVLFELHEASRAPDLIESDFAETGSLRGYETVTRD